MIDWSKYPDLCSALQVGLYDECGNAIIDVEALVSNARRAERERCAETCRGWEEADKALGGTGYLANRCATAIEALGDDDG